MATAIQNSPGTPQNGGSTLNQRIPKRAANAETILVDASNLTMIDRLNITAKEWVKWRSGTEVKCRSTSPDSHPDIVRNGITPDGLVIFDLKFNLTKNFSRWNPEVPTTVEEYNGEDPEFKYKGEYAWLQLPISELLLYTSKYTGTPIIRYTYSLLTLTFK